jgi:hypothetical protein
MWIFLNDSFLSIVQKPGDRDHLTVRARLRGDIEAVFPAAEVVEGAGTDYRFRARIPRSAVAEALMQKVMSLSYPNFKSSVRNHERHDAYMDVWDVMNELQERSID